MGLFTTRQLLGYTEQKVKFRALFLELFFRRTVNFHTEEVMLDKITGKTPVAAYVSPVVEGKVLRHRGGETRVLRPGYVKPKSRCCLWRYEPDHYRQKYVLPHAVQ